MNNKVAMGMPVSLGKNEVESWNYFLTLSPAELGGMKSSVDALPFSINASDKAKRLRVVLNCLKAMCAAKGKDLKGTVELVDYTTLYIVSEDNLQYIFNLRIERILLPPKPVSQREEYKLKDADL